MDKAIYILQKDLPDSKVGDEYICLTHAHPYGAYYKNGNIECGYWMKEDVENNPEWFKLKQEEPTEVISFIHKPIEGYEGSLYKFLTNNPIPPEKYELIKRAIEFVLNNEPTDLVMGGYTFSFQKVITKPKPPFSFFEDIAKEVIKVYGKCSIYEAALLIKMEFEEFNK